MNALTFVRPADPNEKYNLVSSDGRDGGYKLVSAANPDIAYPKLYLSNIEMGDEIIDGIAERVLDGKSRVIISVARTLEEVGRFDARFKLSPVMLLHRIGLLQKCDALAGGVYLDRDDVDLMVQCEIPLILTPTFDMGSGHGIPEAVMYIKRGLRMGLGSEDCSFNPFASAEEEGRILSLAASATMREREAVTSGEIRKMLNFSF